MVAESCLAEMLAETLPAFPPTPVFPLAMAANLIKYVEFSCLHNYSKDAAHEADTKQTMMYALRASNLACPCTGGRISSSISRLVIRH